MKPANALAMPLSAKLGLAGLFALVTVMVLFAAPLAAQPINVITVDCTPFVSPNFTSFGPDNTMGMSLQMVDQGTDFNVTEVTPAAFRALTASQLSAFDLIAINNNPSRIDCGSGLGLGTTWHSVIGVNAGGRVLLSSHDAARFKIIIPPGGAFFGLGAPGPGIEPFGADELVRQAALWAGGGAQTGLLIFNDSARFFTVLGAGWNNPELNLPAAWGITDLDQTGGGPTDGGYTDILPAFQTHAVYAGLSDARFGIDSVSSFAANIADGSFHSIFGSFNATIFTPTEVVVNAGVIDVGGFNDAFGIGAFLSPAGPDGSAITLIRDDGPPPGPTSIEVNKTASFDGRYVSGTISITNMGENPAVISAIADSLEVHFPRKGKSTPPPLPEGSTPNWLKVADVPIANPSPIPVGETVDIDYSFDLCAAADFAGANSMRNVVAVTLANKPEKAKKDTVVTRSDSFEPQTPECPVTEDLTPCFVSDFWEFDATAGQTVFLEADTLDAATAADLCFVGDCGGVDFFFGDDDFACTFPPPAFSCPRNTLVAATSGTCTVAVTTCSSACADPGMANYSLTVELDGVGAPLTLTDDDIGAPPQPSCHDLCVMGDPLLPSCDPCAEAICAVDPYCCDVAWDEICVDEVSTVCGGTCPSGLLDSSLAIEWPQTKAGRLR